MTGNEEGEWNPELLTTAIEQEGEKVCQNALMYCGFQFVVRLIKPQEPQQLYQRFVGALKAIAGEDEQYQMVNAASAEGKPPLQQQIEGMIGRELDLTKEKDRRVLSTLTNSMKQTLANHAGKLDQVDAKLSLHNALYFSLLSVIIEMEGKSWAHQNIAKGFTPIVYLLLDLFIRPFTKTLIQKFQDNMVNPSKGHLTAQHLGPVVAGTNTFGNLCRCAESMARTLKTTKGG